MLRKFSKNILISATLLFYSCSEKQDRKEVSIEVPYTNDKAVNSMRTAVYQFCRQKDYTVKSRRDSTSKKIYFYRDK